MLFKVVGTLLDETLLCDVHMKATEEYFLMILFNILNMVVLTVKSGLNANGSY